MSEAELDLAFKKAFRRQSSLIREVDGEYLDYDRRQRAYADLRKLNEELERLTDIDIEMRAALPSKE
jgi:hypothetical protein